MEAVGVAGVVPQGNQLIAVVQEIRVGGVLDAEGRDGIVEGPHHAGRDGLAALLLICEGVGLRPAVAIACLAVAKVHAVHHAVAIEGVVAILRLVNGVRAVAEVGAVQVRGQFALNAQVLLAQLMDRGCVDAVKIGIVEVVDPLGGVVVVGDVAEAVLDGWEFG